MFCIGCSEPIGSGIRTCPACGAWNSQAKQIPEQKSISYDVEIKKYTSSASFIIGCSLITLGTASFIFGNSTWQNILGLAFAAVHVIGLWLLVFDGFSSEDSYSKTLTALKLFKLSAVLSLILICIVFGVLLITVLITILRGITALLVLAIIGSIGYVLIRFYYMALFKILNSIRARIETDKFFPLEGIGSFLVLSYILIAVALLGVLISVIQYTVATPVVTAISAATAQPGTFALSVMLSIMSNIGMLLCLRTLKRYSD